MRTKMCEESEAMEATSTTLYKKLFVKLYYTENKAQKTKRLEAIKENEDQEGRRKIKFLEKVEV